VGTQLIIAAEVVATPNDRQQLQPMVEQVIANAAGRPG
jgi:hypothetical protein